MKVAIIGSRGIHIENLVDYLPKNTEVIISGGAKGVDTDAKNFAHINNIQLVEFLPEYSKYKKGAPLRRNVQIAEYSDLVIAFWDGKSKGTKFVIDYCNKKGIQIEVYQL